MGITGNLLDLTYNKSADIPIILHKLASQCVTAALTSPSNCPFATASMHKSDPATDIVARINAIGNALSKRSYYMAEDNDKFGKSQFSIYELSYHLAVYPDRPINWGATVQYLSDMEQIIALDPPIE